MDFNLNNKTCDAVIHEAAEFFKSQGYSVLNNGFGEIISDPRLLDGYKKALCEGIEDANRAAEMDQLLTNSAESILLTESISGISPISSMTLPVIRKLWAKSIARESLKTIVLKAPIASIAYTKPYLQRINEDGEIERLELPRQAFKHDEAAYETSVDAERDLIRIADCSTTGTFVECDFTKAPATDEVGQIKELHKTPLDKVVEAVSVDFGDARVVSVYKKVGLDPVIMADVKVTGTSDTATLQLIVRVDYKTAKCNVALIGTLPGGVTQAKVTIRGKKSSEYNEIGWEVGYDIARQEISVGTGVHINAPVTVEMVQDSKALYNIDALNELSDLMTNVVAQKLDYEIIEFLLNCYLNRPQNEAYPAEEGYGDSAKFLFSFNVKPAANYAGSPTAWRNEIRTVLEFAATSLIKENYAQEGSFVILGNPVDTALLRNVDWAYKAGTSNVVDGTNISYTTGIYQGTYVYKVVSSLNFQEGQLLMLFIPSGDKQLTAAYFPYSFTVEKGNGYRGNMHTLVPNIMVTKRHAFHEFMPATAMIKIENNSPEGWYRA